MPSASLSSRNLLSTGVDTNKETQCAYCKATGHFYNNGPKLKKKKGMEDETARNHSAQPTHHATHMETNQPTERCWQGAGAHIRPKRTRNDEKANDESNNEGKSKKSRKNEDSYSGQLTSKKLESKN